MKSCSCRTGTTGTLSQNLEALGISDITDGINLALSHLAQSSFSLAFGKESASAKVLCDCKSTIRLRADVEIVFCQCLQSMQITQGFLQPTTSISHRFRSYVNLRFFCTAYPLFLSAKAAISSNSCQQSKLLMCSTSAPNDAAFTANFILSPLSTSMLWAFK